MFSFIAGESPTDSSKRCYYDDGLASFVFGLYDGIGPIKRKRKMFGITAKLYTVLVLLSSSIYTIGVWLLTPGSLIKNIMLGIGLSVQLLLMFYFLFKRINEEADERFYRNIAKSSSILFTIAIFILLGMATLIAICKVFVLNAGFLYILVAFYSYYLPLLTLSLKKGMKYGERK